MVNIHFNCPKCNQPFDIPSDMAGERVICPNCNGSIQVPAARPVGPPPFKHRDTILSEPNKNAKHETQHEQVLKFAKWSLICGILSLTCMTIVAGIPAIMLGHQARKKCRISGFDLNGRALAGLICGYTSVVLMILMSLLIAADVLTEWYVDRVASAAVKSITIPAVYSDAKPFLGGYALVREHGSYKWGIIDKSGKYVFEPRFTAQEGYISPGIYPYMATDDELYDPNIVGYFSPYGDLKKSQNGGYIYRDGRIVKSRYFDDFTFSSKDGLTEVIVNNRHGLFDMRKAQMIIGPAFDRVLAPKRCENITVFCQNKKWGVIDLSGKIIKRPTYDYALEFSDGLSAVNVGATNFTDGGQVQGGKWGFINTNGEISIAIQYSHTSMFANQRAIVNVGSMDGIIDANGNFVVQPQYFKIFPVSDKSYTYCLTDGGKEGLISSTGVILAEPKYNSISNADSNGYHQVCLDGKWGFLSVEGKTLIECKYDYANEFSGALSAVAVGATKKLPSGFPLEARWGYIDRAGDWFIEPMYAHASSFSDSLASVLLEEGIMMPCQPIYINESGCEVLRLPHRVHCDEFYDGMAVVWYKEAYGYVAKPK